MYMGTSKNPYFVKISIFNSLVPLRIPFRGNRELGVNRGPHLKGEGADVEELDLVDK